MFDVSPHTLTSECIIMTNARVFHNNEIHNNERTPRETGVGDRETRWGRNKGRKRDWSGRKMGSHIDRDRERGRRGGEREKQRDRDVCAISYGRNPVGRNPVWVQSRVGAIPYSVLTLHYTLYSTLYPTYIYILYYYKTKKCITPSRGS